MKRIILFLFPVFYQLSSFAQVDSVYVKYSLMQTISEQSVSVYTGTLNYRDAGSAEWTESKSFYEVILTLNNDKDTVILHATDYSTKTLGSLSLNLITIGNRKQAIHIVMKLGERSNLGEHGGYDAYKTIHEIREAVSGRLLFTAVSDYAYTASYDDWDDTSSHHSETEYSYQYDFNLSRKGKITISHQEKKLNVSGDKVWINMNTSFPSYCDCLLPDHKEGDYVYRNGKYKFQKIITSDAIYPDLD